MKQVIDKFKSTKLMKNIRELQARAEERELAELIYRALDGYVNTDPNRAYITEKIMSIMRSYKF